VHVRFLEILFDMSNRDAIPGVIRRAAQLRIVEVAPLASLLETRGA
jgi:hypothetical protein